MPMPMYAESPLNSIGAGRIGAGGGGGGTQVAGRAGTSGSAGVFGGCIKVFKIHGRGPYVVGMASFQPHL